MEAKTIHIFVTKGGIVDVGIYIKIQERRTY